MIPGSGYMAPSKVNPHYEALGLMTCPPVWLLRPFVPSWMPLSSPKAWSNRRFCNARHWVQCKEATVHLSIATISLGTKGGSRVSPSRVCGLCTPACTFISLDKLTESSDSQTISTLVKLLLLCTLTLQKVKSKCMSLFDFKNSEALDERCIKHGCHKYFDHT
ncbi:uncharacterized protein LOC130784725 isoform X2 [Actinidia eriantha]|uniref:uncharacterized protein LOC130784725 isoform X2 n=1 Tax=Actinidia eriantha TaxID=165200 RepID=UPI00258C7834|nr:uncharacterized protein LOC130784725 isoform X2 [Actinidia eriantha]